MKKCSIALCEKPVKGAGYCNAHYIRFRKYGDPRGGRPVMSGDPINFIKITAINYEGDDCLIWPFSLRADGRGQVRYNGKNQIASRVVCIIAHGDPPSEKYEAAHSCGNGHIGCVNHKHIRWATMIENENDKFIHGTTPSGAKNGNTKLTRSLIEEIKMLSNYMTYNSLAAMFGVSVKTIGKVANGKIWPADRSL